MTDVPVLSIGIITGGVFVDRELRQALKDLMRRVIAVRDAPATAVLPLNVVFELPGEVSQPDHEGIRKGRYTKRDGLMVEVGIPNEPSNSPQEDVKRYLRDAFDFAETFARDRKLSDNVDYLWSIYRKL